MIVTIVSVLAFVVLFLAFGLLKTVERRRSRCYGCDEEPSECGGCPLGRGSHLKLYE